MFFQSAAVLALAATVSAQAVHQVTVGGAAGFVFTPNSITAAAGDIVAFTFVGPKGNHTVTESTFAAPCSRREGGFDSGFAPVDATTSQSWNLTVTDVSAPIWFYCRQLNPSLHCASGMVGAINPPTTGNTIDAFVAAAKNLAAAPPAQTPTVALTGVGASATATPSASTTASAAPTDSASASGSGSAPTPSTTPSGAFAQTAVSAGAVVLALFAGVALL